MFTALDNYEATDFFDDELKQAIAEARKVLPEFKQVLSPKNLQSLRANPPKASNKDFLSYLKKYDIKLPYGTKFRRTVNGFHQYVHPDGTGTDIPVHWDDKKPTPQTSPAPVQPNDKTSPLTLENIGELSANDILTKYTQDDILKFWTENEDKIRNVVDPAVIDEIIEIVNEIRKP